jgi:hypothetical protein
MKSSPNEARVAPWYTSPCELRQSSQWRVRQGAPIECRQKAAWWASVWVIWAVAWFGIDPFETANSAVR